MNSKLEQKHNRQQKEKDSTSGVIMNQFSTVFHIEDPTGTLPINHQLNCNHNEWIGTQLNLNNYSNSEQNNMNYFFSYENMLNQQQHEDQEQNTPLFFNNSLTEKPSNNNIQVAEKIPDSVANMIPYNKEQDNIISNLTLPTPYQYQEVANNSAFIWHHEHHNPSTNNFELQQSSLNFSNDNHQHPIIINQSFSSPLDFNNNKKCYEHPPSTFNTNVPTVVSSISEPIPMATTTNTYHTQQSQIAFHKRTRSICNNSDMNEYHQPNMNDYIVQTQSFYQQQPDQIDYLPTSKSGGTEFFPDNLLNNSSQILAAMPRKQKLRFEGDNYTPKWVRFTGHLKEGYCDNCNPGKWLQLKNSAYWYHKQFYHGISSVTGKSFMKPLEQRMGKGDTIEGLCHQCGKFVSACNGKKKNNYMLWYRHAHKCHLYDKPKVTSRLNGSTNNSVRKLSTISIQTSGSSSTTSTSSNSSNNYTIKSI